MSDYIVRATAANKQIRVYAAVTKELCERARSVHKTAPTTTVALGRMLTAGGLMGSMMKNDDEVLTLQIRCEGPLDGITVTANSRAQVKGYAFNPKADGENPLVVRGIIGDAGTLTIIKDIGLKEPYVGTSAMVSGEIAEDITYYYAISEQTPTSVALGVTLNDDDTVRQAGGFIIQLLPDTDEDTVITLEKILSQAPSITDLLDEGKTPEGILENLLGDFGLDILDTVPTSFTCDCSRDRVTKALMSVGRDELQNMIDEGNTIEVNCDFCQKHYYFTPEDLALLKQTLPVKKA